MKLAIYISIAMLAIIAIGIIPAYAFVIGPNPNTDDNKWELFGPHVQGIVITVYDSTTTEWTDMNLGKIDITDWALDSTHLTLWNVANGPITTPNYGGDNGYFLLDINNNATYTPDDSIAGVHNPTSELPLREAIAYACNRSYITQFSEGLDLPIYTPVPLYMSGYVNPTIYPGQGNQSLTYSNLVQGAPGNCDIGAAIAILNTAGYTIDGSGWRIDPVSQGGTGAELNLIFYSRTGDRGTIGDDINTNLNTLLHIKTSYQGHVARATVTGPVFAQEYYNMYTGGWTGIGPDPDYICDLYNGSNYYHPGSPPNYLGLNYTDLNTAATAVKLATDANVGLSQMLNAQYYFAYHACGVPLYSTSGYKAYKEVPSETSHSMANVGSDPTGNWMDIVNQKSVGANSWWSTLDMQTYGDIYPLLNVTYGFSSSVTLQNEVYIQWFWDTEVSGRIYDGGWARDPYTLLYSNTTGMPQLFDAYSVSSWGPNNYTAVTIHLHPGMYWQDGQPITIADVIYSFTEISDELLAKNLPPPWWYPTVQYMQTVEELDPYTVQVLLNVASTWAAGWVAGSLVLPKHIWEPIVAASSLAHPIVQGTTPDPNIIGSGPYRWVSGIGTGVGSDISIVLVANTPGSVVHGITSPGYYYYCPVWAQIVGPSKVSPGVNPTVTQAFTLNLYNLWRYGDLKGTYYFYQNGVLQSGPAAEDLLTASPYPMGPSFTTTVTLTLAKKTIYKLDLDFHIEGNATLTVTEPWGLGAKTYSIANPWISQWINATVYVACTLPVDIGGTSIFDYMGLGSTPTFMKSEAPAPDGSVNIKDISLAAKAFGSVPGQPNWSTVADVNHDFKVDIRDISLIAKQFGF